MYEGWSCPIPRMVTPSAQAPPFRKCNMHSTRSGHGRAAEKLHLACSIVDGEYCQPSKPVPWWGCAGSDSPTALITVERTKTGQDCCMPCTPPDRFDTPYSVSVLAGSFESDAGVQRHWHPQPSHACSRVCIAVDCPVRVTPPTRSAAALWQASSRASRPAPRRHTSVGRLF